MSCRNFIILFLVIKGKFSMSDQHTEMILSFRLVNCSELATHLLKCELTV